MQLTTGIYFLYLF